MTVNSLVIFNFLSRASSYRGPSPIKLLSGCQRHCPAGVCSLWYSCATITWSRPGCSNISSTLVDGRVSIFSESMKVENTSFHKSALQLCNVVAGDASSYTCTADNGIGGNGISSSTFSSSIEVNPIQRYTLINNNSTIAV